MEPEIDNDANERPMTQREERFCEEFLVDLNGTRAAIRSGYSSKTAYSIAHELLQKPHIAAYVEQLKVERSTRTRITADRVLAELASIAFSDLRDYSCNDAGQMRLAAGAPSFAARAVASIKRKKHYGKKGEFEATVEFKLWDKVAALRQLAPHVGLVTDRGELTGKGGGAIEHIVRVVREPFVAPVHDDDE